MLDKIRNAARNHHTQRRASLRRRALMSLDDHMLRDIGVHRITLRGQEIETF